jgi:predicted permease
MTAWWRKLSGRLRRDEIEAELREEMQFHLEMKAADSPDERAARQQFGNSTLLLEDSRDAWGWPRIEAWLRDFRYAVRVVLKQPAFASTVVLTLALGIGASSTIFSLIDTVLIRPLPYPDSNRLVALHDGKISDAGSRTRISPARLEDLHRLNKTFESIAGSVVDTLTDTTNQVPERVSGVFVSPRFFAVLQTPAALGRVLTPEEERFGGPAAALISDGLWRRRFGSDPGVIGQRLVLSGQPFTIVGVMPPHFRYPDAAAEIWLPKQAGLDLMLIREARFYVTVGRLKPGVTPEAAQSDLSAVQQQLGGLYPKTDAGWSVAVEPLKDQMVGKVRLALGLLLGSVSLLLLIACANVACLLLARLNSRSVEIATRCSLGAGRSAIARQLLSEGLVYSFAGGLLGMAAVYAGVDFLRKRLPDIPRISELAVDARVLALVVGVCVLAAILFSLAPIVQTFRRDLSASLIGAGIRVIGSRQRLPRILVSTQLALATALLIGAGLFLRSLVRLQEAPLGFHPENVLALRVSPGFNESPDVVVQRHRRILDAISTVSGVTTVSMSTGLPAANPAWPREFQLVDEPTPDGTLRFASWRIVTAAYFQTLSIPLLDGRSCRMDTLAGQPFETVVNRSFADLYFRGRNPIGHQSRQGPQGDIASEIVGVVADAREDGHNKPPQPVIYACGYLRYWPDADYLIQSSRPAAMANAVRTAIRTVEPSRPIYSVQPLSGALHSALAQTRFRALLVSFFSLMALTLAAIGLYGVMAYMVAQRTREIGIRIALGARPGRIVGDILRSGGMLIGAGAAAGILLAFVASRLMSALLYGVPWADVATYLSATGVLLGVAFFACLIPGRRATTIDPTQALRDQ